MQTLGGPLTSSDSEEIPERPDNIIFNPYGQTILPIFHIGMEPLSWYRVNGSHAAPFWLACALCGAAYLSVSPLRRK